MYVINEIQFIPLKSNKYFMVNLINAAADIIDDNTYKNITNNNFKQLQPEVIDKLIERRYLFDDEDHYKKFILEFDNEIENKEMSGVPGFLLVPTYLCNLKCIYCYEQTYKIDDIHNADSIGMVDKQMEQINSVVRKYKKDYMLDNNKDVKITIMGGEPLLKVNKNIIKHVFEIINKEGYGINIVTNGVDLDSYIDELIEYGVEHIQVTLDGTKEIHDTRRIFHDGKGSFDKILLNIEKALEKNIKIYLRVNVDRTNINDLPKLAEILYKKFGENDNLNPYIYLLQDGGCAGSQNVMDEKVGIERVFELEENNPQMKILFKKFHASEFIKAIFENEAYQPILRHCGASKNQHIFDCKGNMYRCWHGIGNDDYRIGVFEPSYKINEKLEQDWKNRSVKKIEECKKCKYRYICGTGCPAATHKEREKFEIDSPNCVDYARLLETIILCKLKQVNMN